MRMQHRGFSVVRVIAILLGLAILFYVGASIFYEHVPDSRLAGTALYSASSELRLQVAENIANSDSIAGSGGGLENLPALESEQGPIERAVDANGVITLRSARHGVAITLTPSIRDGGVEWKCQGEPTSDVPMQCR